MTCVQFHASGDDGLGRDLQGLQLHALRRALAAVGVPPCVQLDRVHVQMQGCLDLGRLGVEEEGDFEPGMAAAIDGLGDSLALAHNVESSLGGQLLRAAREPG